MIVIGMLDQLIWFSLRRTQGLSAAFCCLTHSSCTPSLNSASDSQTLNPVP